MHEAGRRHRGVIADKYGHTKALLVLDAGEVLDRSADPPSSPSAA